MKRQEPYESMPEGEACAFADLITKLVVTVLLILIGVLCYALDARAGENWCSQWADGFETGYCWRKADCDYIPPQICPAPKDGQTDGYVVGLRQGLEAGKVTL